MGGQTAACLPAFPKNDGSLEALALLPVAAGSTESSSTTETDGGTTTPAATLDTTAPTFAGVTTTTTTSFSTIDLAWTAATDDVSATSAIVYEICQQTTATSCQGTFTATYTTAAGATNYSVTGLTGYTDYYFVIRAKDEASNVDTNTIEMTTRTSAIKLWRVPTVPSGFTRTSINTTCDGGKAATCASAAALLSFTATDEIRDMPGNYGVPTNVSIRNVAETNEIVPNWASLVDGNIDSSLSGAGASSGNYWTGSTTTGALGADHCLGWASTSGGQDGTTGNSNFSNGDWLDNNTAPCTGSRGVLCICW